MFFVCVFRLDLFCSFFFLFFPFYIMLIVLGTLFVDSLLELGQRNICTWFSLVLGDIKILDHLEASSASEGPCTN